MVVLKSTILIFALTLHATESLLSSKLLPLRSHKLFAETNEVSEPAPIEAVSEESPTEVTESAERKPLTNAYTAPKGINYDIKYGFSYDNLKSLASEQNPVVQYFDPLYLGDQDFWGQGNEATIGFLRQAEIKHGRVAMAAFIGYLVHDSGTTWPFPMKLDGTPWPTADSVPELWDKLPEAGKWQIILFVGALEWFDEWQIFDEGSELNPAENKPKHYMRGGMPGKFSSFDGLPLPLNLYDPFNFTKKKTDEQLAKGRIAEVNNGRLAMIGIMGFLAESVKPGSVPFLDQFNFPVYSGNIMVPFEGNFELFS